MTRAESAEGLQARDELVLRHLSLVRALATRLVRRVPPQVATEDLVSAGLVGLVEAAGRYRASTGVPFEAFARRRVQGAMLDALRDLDWAPRSLRKLRRVIDGAHRSLRQNLGCEPSDTDVAATLHMTAIEYARAQEQLRALEAGALPREVCSGEELLNATPGGEASIEARLCEAERRQLVAAALSTLAARERRVLALSFRGELTLAQIGLRLGVCESRVSQIRSLAISRLRASLNADTLSLVHTVRPPRPARRVDSAQPALARRAA